MNIMTDINKKKLRYSLWSLAYLGLTAIIVISATSIFNNYYYESVYVSGSSMQPTFDGDGASKSLGSDYGIVDKSRGAKNTIKRYQIVTTYYPSDVGSDGKVREDASYKIKRVLVKPGETFKVENNDLYIYNHHTKSWGERLDMPFQRNLETIVRNVSQTTLKDDEYFLAGDNWAHSSDSFSVGPINYDLLVGVVAKMQGKCTIRDGKVVEKAPYEARYFLGVDY